MRTTDSDVRQICAIAKEVSARGAGLSMRDALAQSRYRDVRRDLTATSIMAALRAEPELVDEWLRYSQDKRTSGGWHLERAGSGWQVGSLEGQKAPQMFSSAIESCATYILRELDFWAALGAAT